MARVRNECLFVSELGRPVCTAHIQATREKAHGMFPLNRAARNLPTRASRGWHSRHVWALYLSFNVLFLPTDVEAIDLTGPTTITSVQTVPPLPLLVSSYCSYSTMFQSPQNKTLCTVLRLLPTENKMDAHNCQHWQPCTTGQFDHPITQSQLLPQTLMGKLDQLLQATFEHYKD